MESVATLSDFPCVPSHPLLAVTDGGLGEEDKVLFLPLFWPPLSQASQALCCSRSISPGSVNWMCTLPAALWERDHISPSLPRGGV